MAFLVAASFEVGNDFTELDLEELDAMEEDDDEDEGEAERPAKKARN